MVINYDIEKEQAEIMEELNSIFTKKLPIVENIVYNTFGVLIENRNVIGLSLFNQGLSILPEIICKLTSLKTLNLASNNLTSLPDSIKNLTSLEELSLENNKLAIFPKSLSSIISLEKLNLRRANLKTLPESIAKLSSLTLLNLQNNLFENFPESITALQSLEHLNLKINPLKTLPDSISRLKSLKMLNLSRNLFETLPESIGDLDSIEKLDVELNQLKTICESIGNLSSLQWLNFTSNHLKTIPESIGKLTSLKELYLFYNELSALPNSIGNLSSLKTLGLDQNKLTSLPDSMGNLFSLENLYISKNQLRALPTSFWRLNSLKNVNLGKNQWQGPCKNIAEDDISRVLEICRQRAPIKIFISYAHGDEYIYQLNALKREMNSKEEISEVFVHGENDVLDSNLFVFIATKNSITDERCLHELKSALSHNISIIPIKGRDLEWAELNKIQSDDEFKLSDKLGLPYDGMNVDKFCNELYEHIKKFKREINLFEVKERILDKQWLNVKIISEKLIQSKEFREKSIQYIDQLKDLTEKLNSKQLTSIEYIIRTGSFFDQIQNGGKINDKCGRKRIS
ncbi:MAG: hypothetical protein GF364_03405 [Candidatus Lokiarchaeota archaeon]|nr:hypothetical protein [Candidatus Lokiarchaeota archaeon]